MDPLIAALLGALVGGLLSLRIEGAQWLRNRRVDAQAGLLDASNQWFVAFEQLGTLGAIVDQLADELLAKKAAVQLETARVVISGAEGAIVGKAQDLRDRHNNVTKEISPIA